MLWAQGLRGGVRVRVNGEFDSRTKQAVIALQERSGLPGAGRSGDRTWADCGERSARVRWTGRRPPLGDVATFAKSPPAAGARAMRRALVVVLAASLLTAVGQAEIVRDGRDVAAARPRPVKLGQHERRLLVRLRTGARCRAFSPERPPSLGRTSASDTSPHSPPAVAAPALPSAGFVMAASMSRIGARRSGVRRKARAVDGRAGKAVAGVELELSEVGLKPGKLTFSRRAPGPGRGASRPPVAAEDRAPSAPQRAGVTGSTPCAGRLRGFDTGRSRADPRAEGVRSPSTTAEHLHA